MNALVEGYIERVDRAIDFGLDRLRLNNFEIGSMRTKLTHSIFSMNGMSTDEVRILLNELVKEDTNYLEIGIHRGSTFVSALYLNEYNSAFAIDNFGGPMYADDILNKFLSNCKEFSINNFTLFKNDSFKLDKNQKEQIKDINLYFYDGGHNFEEQKMALTYYYSNLSDCFIFIVDDWVHLPAADGTKAAIKELNLKVHKEWILGHSQHIKDHKALSWHNGLYIAVLEKTK